jgi:hypothetical protein
MGPFHPSPEGAITAINGTVPIAHRKTDFGASLVIRTPQ